MNLDTMEIISCFVITELRVSDFLQVGKFCISFSGSLRHLKVETTTEVAVSEPCSSLKSLFASVLQCITDKSFSCGRFPYHENTVYEWFNHPCDKQTRNQILKVRNVEKQSSWDKDSLSTAVNFDELHSGDDDAFEIFYHGTSHQYAKQIIGEGIILRNGKKEMDFSSSDGFYVSKDLYLAENFASKRPQAAVLVFQVNKGKLRWDINNCYNGLDLTSNISKWKEVVKYFLNCQEEPSRKYVKSLQPYDFIEGPMVSKSKKKNFKKYPSQIHGSYQLCVRSKTCVELFEKSLCAAIFFSR